MRDTEYPASRKVVTWSGRGGRRLRLGLEHLGYGRTISRNAADTGVELAITGRTGAAFLGVLGTSSPLEVRCWARLNGRSLEEGAAAVGLAPAPRESMNVRVLDDPWRTGVHRHANAQFDEWTATVAHPVRVWCDLHAEERGREFASLLWGKASHAW